jgi:hypothetical protein
MVIFRQIIGVTIQNGEPIFDPETTKLIDVRLDADETERQESNLADLVLRDEVRRLIAHLQVVENGRIDRIDIRAGIPRRIVIERRVADRILL